MIYNLNDFRERIGEVKEHIILAENILKEMKAKNLILKMEFTNKSLQTLAAKVKKDW